MIDYSKYELNHKELMLVKFDFNFKTKNAIEVVFNELSDQEKIDIFYITSKFPTISSEKDDELYWDIILVDTEIVFYLENILVKHNVDYVISFICEQYYKKSKKLTEYLITQIDEYLEKILDIDKVLDRINEVGLDKINKFELKYLEKQSKI